VLSQGTVLCTPPVLIYSTRLPYNLYCVGGDVKHCTI